MSRLTLFLFDRLRAVLDGAPLNNFRSAKAQALLAYLVLESRRAHTRDALATLFWPDEPGAVSKQNLRQALYQLRQLLGESASTFLLTTRDTVQFNPDSSYSLDVADFQVHLEKHDLEAAVEVYQGDLLAELAINSEPFEEWLLLARERLHILALDALGQLARRALDQADPAVAQALCAPPISAGVLARGSPSTVDVGAGHQRRSQRCVGPNETCRRILASELGVEPDEETQKLVETIRRGALPGPRTRRDRMQNSDVHAPSRQDWGEVPDTPHFYGRKAELAQVEQWLLRDQCRLVAIVGMGGMGKTTLAAKAARDLGNQFQFVIWRSLVNAPPLDNILYAWAKFFSNQRLADWPDHLDAQLSLVFEYLRTIAACSWSTTWKASCRTGIGQAIIALAMKTMASCSSAWARALIKVSCC